MESEPPTPTRAPDNQFRKMQDQLSYVRDTDLFKCLGLGSEVPMPSVKTQAADVGVGADALQPVHVAHLPCGDLTAISPTIISEKKHRKEIVVHPSGKICFKQETMT